MFKIRSRNGGLLRLRDGRTLKDPVRVIGPEWVTIKNRSRAEIEADQAFEIMNDESGQARVAELEAEVSRLEAQIEAMTRSSRQAEAKPAADPRSSRKASK